MELEEFIRLVQIQIWPCGRRAQFRNNGDCLSSPHLEATQLGFSLYVSGGPDTLPFCHCPFARAQSECLQARVFVWTFLENTCISSSLSSHLDGQIPADFSQLGVLWVPLPSIRLRSLTPRGRPLKLRYPSPFLTTTHGFGASPFCMSNLPTSLNMPFSLYF